MGDKQSAVCSAHYIPFIKAYNAEHVRATSPRSAETHFTQSINSVGPKKSTGNHRFGNKFSCWICI